MKFNRFALAAALAVASLGAQAATVTLSNITGAWSNAIGATTTIAGSGTAAPTARWGGDAGLGQSGYNFSAVGSASVDVPPDSPLFSIGTFEHVNFPVFPPSITGIDLTISALITVDTTNVGVRSFVFRFTHEETTNTPPGQDPCPYGGANLQGVNINGCADRVTVTGLDTSESFAIGGTDYTVTLAGFQVGGVFQSAFLTQEQVINTANLMAQVTTTVPEPGSLALVGLSLLGLAAARRRNA